MAPLAKLPVFLDLAGRRAVLAGNGAPLAWKAELVAAAGAHVDIYAERPCAELVALAEATAAAGSIRLMGRAWRPQDLAGAGIAVGAFGSAGEAEAFVRAARCAGAPVNVIDNPAFCDFQFGSIVNRSPVVVGISSDGAAPILATAIRRRIEAMLPTGLAAWALAARSFRRRLKAFVPDCAARRHFWERFADLAFRGDGAPQASVMEALAQATIGSRCREGEVILVGAGPGDPELLTLKAVRALQSADVILYDQLVSEAVLDLARREAKRMLVGKRARRSSCRQDDINALMVALAKKGKRVVRLKSGDPSIFGRAGEEIAFCRRHGVRVSVVPGVTAAFAAAASLGLSLTHRDHARRLQFVTGHARSGALPDDVDWTRIADKDATTALYMGRGTAAAFANRAIAAGLPSDTPVVAVENVSRADETVICATLATLSQALAGCGDGPVLILIGTVVAEAGACEADLFPAMSAAMR